MLGTSLQRAWIFFYQPKGLVPLSRAVQGPNQERPVIFPGLQGDEPPQEWERSGEIPVFDQEAGIVSQSVQVPSIEGDGACVLGGGAVIPPGLEDPRECPVCMGCFWETVDEITKMRFCLFKPPHGQEALGCQGGEGRIGPFRIECGTKGIGPGSVP